MNYRTKIELAERASKAEQLRTGKDFTFEESEEFKNAYIEGLNMDEQVLRAQHRDRFVAASSKADARRKLRIQRAKLIDTLLTLQEWPWMYTNAGVIAEAAAHWAFTAFPELRVDDDNAQGIGLSVK